MSDHCPADLATFWQNTLERTRAQPLEVQIEKMPLRLPYHVYRLTYRSMGGIPVRAYLSLPIQVASESRPPRRLPAIVAPPGYGGWEFSEQLNECQRGYAVLQVYPRSQGESGEVWRIEGPLAGHWIQIGKERPEGFYYQGALMDVIRGVDYLRGRADIDPERIGLMGTSQAGMLVLGAAALDPSVRAVTAHVSALCALRQNPGHTTFDLGCDATLLDTWDYFDPLHLASRIRVPTLMSSGGKDTICPADTIRAVFDRLSGIKALIHYPDLIHTACNDFYAQRWQWMDRFL